MQQIPFLINITQSYWMKLWGTNEALENHGILFHRHDRPFSSIWTCLKPLLLREKTLQVTLLSEMLSLQPIPFLKSCTISNTIFHSWNLFIYHSSQARMCTFNGKSVHQLQRIYILYHLVTQCICNQHAMCFDRTY